jgi:hypothetical protein
MTDHERGRENGGSLPDQTTEEPARPEPHAMSMHEGHEAISQILFSLTLTIDAAQREAVTNPARLPELLALLRKQADAGLELMRRLPLPASRSK